VYVGGCISVYEGTWHSFLSMISSYFNWALSPRAYLWTADLSGWLFCFFTPSPSSGPSCNLSLFSFVSTSIASLLCRQRHVTGPDSGLSHSIVLQPTSKLLFFKNSDQMLMYVCLCVCVREKNPVSSHDSMTHKYA